MGFVKEKITTEQDKARFNAYKFVTPVSKKNYEISNSTEWVIDRERDIFMTYLGGGPHEVPDFFVLILPEGRGYFEGFSRAKGEPHPDNRYLSINTEVWWDLVCIDVPKTLQIRKTEILDLIEKSLGAYHRVGELNGVKAVYVRTTYIHKTESQ